MAKLDISKFDIEDEDEDLWSLVYTALIDSPMDTNYKAASKYDVNQLKRKDRYSDVYTDYNGNIVVYSDTEEGLDPAKSVADKFGLEAKPEFSNRGYKLTIKIPDEKVYSSD